MAAMPGWRLLAVANTVLSLFYYARVIGPMIFKPGHSVAQILDRSTKVTMLAAAVAMVGLPVAGGLIWTALTDGILP